MGSEKSLGGQTANRAAVTYFASAAEADRRIAGVAAAARIVKSEADSGSREIWLALGDGAPLASATEADIERLRGLAVVAVVPASELSGLVRTPPVLPSAWEIVRNTAKPGDGPVSRWLNRPVSQRISWLLLQIPAARPIHVTMFNALLALIMIGVLLLAGRTGLVLGGILFHSASVLDGVDGEMARASFRTSDSGAALDSAIDMATNLLFLAGLTANLAWHDGDVIGWIGAWGLMLSVAGVSLIAWKVRAEGAPLGFDLFKRSGRIHGAVELIFWVVQTLTSRDCFAFLFMVLILVGLERTALSIFSGVATLWFVYVLASLIPRPRVFRGAA